METCCFMSDADLGNGPEWLAQMFMQPMMHALYWDYWQQEGKQYEPVFDPSRVIPVTTIFHPAVGGFIVETKTTADKISYYLEAYKRGVISQKDMRTLRTLMRSRHMTSDEIETCLSGVRE